MRETIALRTDRLRSLRESKGWSQRELARRCGFGDAQIRKYEAGLIDPSSTYLKLMADELNVSTDYLLGRTDNIETPITEKELKSEEREIINIFRSGGWAGVVRLGAERLTK